ncbi:CCA tRNA nucleotidyltransferase, mitochondrial [Lachancea thermotolerans]
MLKKAASSLIQRNMVPKLKLTETEQQICRLLKDYTSEYNKSRALSEPLELRITGGWVRDKLLGFNSHDLDIAVNTMSGEQLALEINDFLRRNHESCGITPHSIHKIDKNPEKSKHLETATTKLFGIDVDFVNLRSEEYTTESRIPVVAFGTPKQDALRRDATLNALFYNIQNDEIEDFTGTGLEDLNKGILRTPLPPLQTFLDDPLRVLRLIRFASRLGFVIDPDTYKAMQDPEINKAFGIKISRERVGVEMQKILQGPNPLLGLSLIQKAGLDNVIFSWHSDSAIIHYNRENTDMSKAEKAYQELGRHIELVLEKLPVLLEAFPLLQEHWKNAPVFKQNFILGVIFAPFRGIKIVWNPQKLMNKETSISESIVKDGLKLGRNDAELIAKCVESHVEYNDMILKYESLSRSDIGLEIRSFNGDWELAHLVNLALAYCFDENSLGQYQNFYQFVFDQNLQNSHALKPLIDGKTLSKQLNIKPGRWMGGVVAEMVKWQMDNPGSDEKQVLEFVQTILPNYT